MVMIYKNLMDGVSRQDYKQIESNLENLKSYLCGNASVVINNIDIAYKAGITSHLINFVCPEYHSQKQIIVLATFCLANISSSTSQ